MTEEQIEAARKAFVKIIKNYNRKMPEHRRIGLYRDGEGYYSLLTNEKWAMFLAGYKAALEQTK